MGAFADAVSPIAARLRKEVDALHGETTQFSSGLDRWLEIAERDREPYGLTDQVPALMGMLKSAQEVRPSLTEGRRVCAKLATLNDTTDAPCGELVESLDIVDAVAKETAQACESSLKRLKSLLDGGSAGT